jgi:NAD(P)-dependent dehydrogenase (short-subunit alcohol dehydrogenase family)
MTEQRNTLEGQVALITGGARGIGRAIAVRLAAEGAKIGIVDWADNGQDTAREIEQESGRQTTFFKADISKEADALAAVASVESALGPVDILINNAGITRDGLALTMTESDWEQGRAARHDQEAARLDS